MGEMRFILGRSGAGKTCACLDLIAQELKRSPIDGPAVILLLPEQATFQMSRMLSGWKGLNGFIRARVTSFKKLAMAVMSETHGRPKPMLGVSRKLLMQQIIMVLGDQLKFWNNLPPERIAGSLLKLLDELGQAGLNAEKLAERLQTIENMPAELASKIGDLVKLGKEYERMDQVGLDDPGRYLEAYRELVGQISWLKDAMIYVDGFSGFTGQEYAALLATMGVAKETTITLMLDPSRLREDNLSDEENVFAPQVKTYNRLIELASSAGIRIGEPMILDSNQPGRFEHSATLAALEKCLSGEKVSFLPEKEDDSVVIVSAENPASEVELAAGKILQLVREKGWQFRDISVILRNLEGYEYLLRYVFDHYGIPYFLDVRRPIGQHPVTRLILSAVGAIAENYKAEWMRRYLKTGLTGLADHEADRIENYILAHGIDGEEWRKEWKYRLEHIGREDETNCDASEVFDLRRLNECRRILLRPMERLEKIWDVKHGQEQEFTIEVLLEGLTNFLKDLEVSVKLTELSKRNDSDQSGQIHQQILNVLTELFGQLRLTIMDRMISLTEFLRILTESFAELAVGVIPSNMDQVLIGTIERTRHPSVKASLILGFNEGNWPGKLEDDVVLTDRDRMALCWQDLAVKGDIDEHYLKEQSLMYIAMTRASEFLWVSYVRKDSSGNSLFPSRYLRRIQQILQKSEKVVPVKDSSLLWDTLTPLPVKRERLVCDVMSEIGRDNFDEANEHGIFWRGMAASLMNRQDTADLMRDSILALCDENSPTLETGLAKALFQNKISFSQMESFYRCPFQHFCKYGLRLKESPRYKLEPIDLGTFRHEVMKLAWQMVETNSDDWNSQTRIRVKDIIHKAVAEAAKEIKDDLLFSNARNQYILQRTEAELAMAMDEQLRMLSAGKFIPSEFEKEFSMKVHQSELVGRIDRIDIAKTSNGSWMMIIDYKSGVTNFDLNDWWEGVQLQLPGYLLVAVSGGDIRNIAGGGLYLPLRPRQPKNNGNKMMTSYFPASGMLSRESIDQLANVGDGIYPYGMKVKNDGGISAGPVMVLPLQTISGILKKTHEKVLNGFDAIMAGKIEIKPYYDGRVSVCPMCEMRSICRFKLHVNHYRFAENISKDDILTKVSN
jgi:ATP-dependent helicase/nuclease subunit B